MLVRTGVLGFARLKVRCFWLYSRDDERQTVGGFLKRGYYTMLSCAVSSEVPGELHGKQRVVAFWRMYRLSL